MASASLQPFRHLPPAKRALHSEVFCTRHVTIQTKMVECQGEELCAAEEKFA